MTPSITVVVPVYNEADFLPKALPALIAAVDEVDAPYDLIIVENGSTDGTAEVARRVSGSAPVEVLSLPDPDKGAALRHGYLLAEGDWVVSFDLDYFSTDFLRAVLDQPEWTDVVIGSKRDPASEDRRPLIRRLATLVFYTMVRLILGSRVSDTHGMLAFRSGLLAELAPRVISTKDIFDTELIVRAERAGYRIVEVPVTVAELRTARSGLLTRVPRTIRGLIRIRRSLRARADATNTGAQHR